MGLLGAPSMSVVKSILGEVRRSSEPPDPPEQEDWRDIFLDFLENKSRGLSVCKECRSSSVEVTPALVTVPRWDPTEKDWSLNGTTYPFALLVCKSCGHVNFYSASIAGVKKKDFGKVAEWPSSS